MWQLLPGSKGTMEHKRGPSDSILSPPSFPPDGQSFQEAIVTVTEEEGEGGGGEEGEEQVGPSTVSLPPAAATPLKEEDEPKETTKGAKPDPVHPHPRQRSHTWDPDFRRDSSADLMGTYDRKRGFGRQAFRFRKVAVRIRYSTRFA